MTGWFWGGTLGAIAACGVLMAVSRLLTMRRPVFAVRVFPFVRDVAPLDRPRVITNPSGSPAASPWVAAAGLFGPVLQQGAAVVERVLGGAASVRRRLERANIDKSVNDFRVEQVVWGLAGFGAVAAVGLLRALTSGINSLVALVLCMVGFALGVMWRDTRLTAQVRERERQILLEFPTLAELLALAVAAGESPVAALDRVVKRSGGELSVELSRVLAKIRTGEPVSHAFDELASITGLSLVARFATGVAVAIERGTPLADVLHAQAADVREAGRRELIEAAARKEVAMMAPVVFLVLPVTILFAFFPGAIGLSLSMP